MKETTVKVKNRQGETLVISVIVPERKRKFAAVLVQHGFKGFRKQRHIAAIAKAISDKGILTVRPDLTSNPGDSYLPFSDMTYAQELLDLEDIFDYVLSMSNIDPSKVGITGHSLGGLLVAELASRRKEVKSLALLSAVYDFRWIAKHIFEKPAEEVKKDFDEKGWTNVWSKTLAKNLVIKKEFYMDAFFRTASDFAKNIICPTVIISSEKDKTVSQSHADCFLKTIGSKTKKLEIIKNADHNYSGRSLEKVAGLVGDWFSNTL